MLCVLGDYEDAVSEHETELRLSEALEDIIGAGIANRKIGEVYCEMGQYEKALGHQRLHLEV